MHSSMDHLRALIELAGREGVEDVVLHAFTDGRDTLPHSRAGYVAEVKLGAARESATVRGRYHAMDHDRRWDRTKRAWDAIVLGRAEHKAETGEAAVRAAYDPRRDRRVHRADAGRRRGAVRDGDSVIFNNLARPRPPAHARARRGRLLRVRSRAGPSVRLPRSPSIRRTGTTRSPSRPRARPSRSPRCCSPTTG